MANEKKLTKADLLRTKDDIEEVYIEELEGTLPIRPLTDAEWNKVLACKARGLSTEVDVSGLQNLSAEERRDKIKQGMNLDLSKVQESDYEADCLAVQMGLATEEEWTLEDVKNIRSPGAVRAIAVKIYDASGVSPEMEKAAQRFRKK